ncbi:MAG: YecA family protein [Burkholderiales bacterium]|nr:YecA family protein [Burkholderiales bacterium]
MAKPKKAKTERANKPKSEFRYGPPPTLEELETLERWIEQIPEEQCLQIPNLTVADGVLTGLALCPPLFPARDLFEKYFGEPYQADTEEAAKMRKIILRRYEAIQNQLAKSEILDPYLIFFETEEESKKEPKETKEELKEDNATSEAKTEDFTVDQALEAVSDFTSGFLATINTLVRHKNWANTSDDVLTHIVALCPTSWTLFDQDPDAKAQYRKVARLLKEDFKVHEDVLFELATDIGILGEQLNGWPVNECLDFRDYEGLEEDKD